MDNLKIGKGYFFHRKIIELKHAQYFYFGESKEGTREQFVHFDGAGIEEDNQNQDKCSFGEIDYSKVILKQLDKGSFSVKEGNYLEGYTVHDHSYSWIDSPKTARDSDPKGFREKSDFIRNSLREEREE
jgi:hypothetical protein